MNSTLTSYSAEEWTQKPLNQKATKKYAELLSFPCVSSHVESKVTQMYGFHFQSSTAIC